MHFLAPPATDALSSFGFSHESTVEAGGYVVGCKLNYFSLKCRIINQKSSDSSKRSQKSPLRQRPSKILRVDDPNFEHEVLLESDQSETEENIEDCLVYEDTLIQNHDSDEGEDERNPSSEGNPSPAETPGSEPDDDSSE
uniref:SFRICE_025251 n=1 Tax=Spodoptera frugiperda TaxID=7108 RepID=A0A2H1WG57_SPOFR